jgi:protein tyrosine/serine phosphatase
VVDYGRLVKESLEIVLQKQNLPTLLCCSSGAAPTAVVVGCLRRMQVWSLASIFSECAAPLCCPPLLPSLLPYHSV